jgi:uncharacterized protein (DUF885 family)
MHPVAPPLFLGFLLSASGFVLASEPTAAQRFGAFLAQDWERQMRESPTWASSLGDRRYNDRWEDLSLPAIEQRHRADLASIDALRSIPREQLPPGDRLNYDLFLRMRATDVAEHALGLWLGTPVDAYRGLPASVLGVPQTLRFETERDYRDWLARLETMPVLIEQYRGILQEGVRRKITQPRIVAARIPDRIGDLLGDEPTRSPFYEPFKRFPASIEAATQEQLRDSAAVAVRDRVNPAWRKIKRYIEAEYLPAARDEVGLWAIAGGDAAYAFLVRKFTTVDNLTPEQVHQIGLDEVARIRKRMEAVKDKVGFRGTLREFLDHLRTDPKFFYEHGEELLRSTETLAKGRIDPLLPRLFRRVPRMGYGLRAIPAATAPLQPAGYYLPPAEDGSRGGYYYVNTYAPASRPKWAMTALSLHEAVPGHHFQVALAMEMTDRPNFRGHLGFGAYTEGWALYAEHLGYELGLYDDPYNEMGALTFEMWRAIRLVVDTGIHHKRWTRQQAIDYFMENGSQTLLDIETEVDRYITWPGQALGYKIGEIRIKALRAKAEQELGARFDLKEFHDVVLSPGAVPLDVLERIVNEWIASRR